MLYGASATLLDQHKGVGQAQRVHRIALLIMDLYNFAKCHCSYLISFQFCFCFLSFHCPSLLPVAVAGSKLAPCDYYITRSCLSQTLLFQYPEGSQGGIRL